MSVLLLIGCPHSVVASTSHPHLSHYRVHAGPCGALWCGEAGGAVPLVVPADVAMVRMSGSHWVLYVDEGEGVEGAHGGQS